MEFAIRVILNVLLNASLYCSDVFTNFEFYQSAADRGSPAALCNIGNCYANGIWIQRDWTKAKTYYSKSAESGNPEAEFRLSQCYRLGLGGEANLSKADVYLLRSAEHGFDEAEYELGSELYTSHRSVSQGIEWITKSAIQNNFKAQLMLSNIYRDKKSYNAIKADIWLRRALGNDHVEIKPELEEFEKGLSKEEQQNCEVTQYIENLGTDGDTFSSIICKKICLIFSHKAKTSEILDILSDYSACDNNYIHTSSVVNFITYLLFDDNRNSPPPFDFGQVVPDWISLIDASYASRPLSIVNGTPILFAQYLNINGIPESADQIIKYYIENRKHDKIIQFDKNTSTELISNIIEKKLKIAGIAENEISNYIEMISGQLDGKNSFNNFITSHWVNGISWSINLSEQQINSGYITLHLYLNFRSGYNIFWCLRNPMNVLLQFKAKNMAVDLPLKYNYVIPNKIELKLKNCLYDNLHPIENSIKVKVPAGADSVEITLQNTKTECLSESVNIR